MDNITIHFKCLNTYLFLLIFHDSGTLYDAFKQQLKVPFLQNTSIVELYKT